jgi:hypothetical protein
MNDMRELKKKGVSSLPDSNLLFSTWKATTLTTVPINWSPMVVNLFSLMAYFAALWQSGNIAGP